MKNKKMMLVSMLIVMVAILIIPGKVHAAYQSKPGNALTSRTADQFFEGCRNMEVSGGVLGLSETLETTTYKGTSNNGIDVHMALNTEWGTVALLTDSAYGIGKDISGTNNPKTSTGNATGVCNLANGICEYVASTYNGTSSKYNTKLRSADARYFNSYSSNTSKAGDALNCANWLSASYDSWANASNPVFYRGAHGLFGFSVDYGDSYSNYVVYGSRAVVVCGAGL